MATDPFSTTPAPAEPATGGDDPFSRPSSSRFPKFEDLQDCLVLLRPSLVEQVPNKFRKKPTDPAFVDRATAECVVFGPEGVEEYDDMFFSQTVVVSACKQALKPGARPWVLAVVQKVATKETRDALGIGETAEDFDQAWRAWLEGGGKGTQPRHVWVLADFDEAQANQARTYLQERTAAEAAAEAARAAKTPAPVDPFAATTPES